jgi:hypothetical protein
MMDMERKRFGRKLRIRWIWRFHWKCCRLRNVARSHPSFNSLEVSPCVPWLIVSYSLLSVEILNFCSDISPWNISDGRSLHGGRPPSRRTYMAQPRRHKIKMGRCRLRRSLRIRHPLERIRSYQRRQQHERMEQH